eukprot:913301-Prorocentrum_minimum.AAC.1
MSRAGTITNRLEFSQSNVAQRERKARRAPESYNGGHCRTETVAAGDAARRPIARLGRAYSGHIRSLFPAAGQLREARRDAHPKKKNMECAKP